MPTACRSYFQRFDGSAFEGIKQDTDSGNLKNILLNRFLAQEG